MAEIEKMVNELAETTVPAAAWSVDKKKQKSELEAKKKFLWHELTVLGEHVPLSERESGQLLWLALNHFVFLPKKLHDKEVNHRFGTVRALAAGIAKSALYGMPKIEIHATACPSYLDKTDWEAVGQETGIYVYQQPKLAKIQGLQNFVQKLAEFPQYIKGIYLHTPAPQDLVNDVYSGCFGIFNQGAAGKKSLEVHWQTMMAIVDQVPGIQLCPDVSYLSQFMKPGKAEKLMALPRIQAAFSLFSKSSYIEMAYNQWGIESADVFKVFYLGSTLGYGNHKSVINPHSGYPVKLYLNLEENQSPYTFAGQSVGVDFRHLLNDQGYHLPLLIGKPAIVTPWAGQ